MPITDNYFVIISALLVKITFLYFAHFENKNTNFLWLATTCSIGLQNKIRHTLVHHDSPASQNYIHEHPTVTPMLVSLLASGFQKTVCRGMYRNNLPVESRTTPPPNVPALSIIFVFSQSIII